MSLFEEKAVNTTPISALGEYALIDHLTKGIKIKNKSTVKGVGDDAAVIDIGDKYQLISTDLLVEGVHFDLAYTPLKHLGYKAVAVNVSDICAMNGEAKQITVGLALSNRFSVEALEELYKGMNLACKHYGVDLVGGDTTTSTSGLMISVTALGEVEKDKITYRSGAKVNDLIVATGDLGAAYLGLQLLKREKEIYIANPKMQPDLGGNDYVLQRQLKPEARIDIVKKLKELKIIPTSMIDISDGLASEILHLSEASNLGVKIFEEKLPILEETKLVAKEFDLNFSNCALNGGEEYELLFSITPNEYELIKKNNIDIKPIGYFTKDKSKKIVLSNNKEDELKSFGWKHFN